MSQIRTVKVKGTPEQGGFYLINEDDFNPEIHKLYEEKGKKSGDIEDMTVIELREELGDRGIVLPRGTNKEQMVVLLRDDIAKKNAAQSQADQEKRDQEAKDQAKRDEDAKKAEAEAAAKQKREALEARGRELGLTVPEIEDMDDEDLEEMVGLLEQAEAKKAAEASGQTEPAPGGAEIAPAAQV